MQVDVIGKREPTKPCDHCGGLRAWRPDKTFSPPLWRWICTNCTPPSKKSPPLAPGTLLRFVDPEGVEHVLPAVDVYPGSVTFHAPDGCLHIVGRWLERSKVNGWRLAGRAG